MDMLAKTVGCVALLMFAGCVRASIAPGPVVDQSLGLEEQRARSLAAIDRAECEAGGGTVVQDGLLGLWRCTTPYADAGSSCRDAADCQGRCVDPEGASDDAEAPGAARGVCEADDSPFGCYAVITDGVRGPTLCVD